MTDRLYPLPTSQLVLAGRGSRHDRIEFFPLDDCMSVEIDSAHGTEVIYLSPDSWAQLKEYVNGKH